jgi:hypothetical protein
MDIQTALKRWWLREVHSIYRRRLGIHHTYTWTKDGSEALLYSSIVAMAGEVNVRATLGEIDPLLGQLRHQIEDDTELVNAITILRQRAGHLGVPKAPGVVLKIGVPSKKE